MLNPKKTFSFSCSLNTSFKTVFNNNNQQGGIFGQFNHSINNPEKLIEKYEKRIQEKDELIALLREKKI